MSINERFLQFALLGSEWVLWVLVGLSVIAATVAVERFVQYRRLSRIQRQLAAHAAEVWRRVSEAEESADEGLVGLGRIAAKLPGPAARMVKAAIAGVSAGSVASADRVVASTRTEEQRRMSRYLSVLGTIGANAPFIGLFGTVLEILRVFNLIGSEGLGTSAQSLTIMGGISEALVATGVGLLVAIPAVVGFNAFTRWLESLTGEATEIAELALAVATIAKEKDGSANVWAE